MRIQKIGIIKIPDLLGTERLPILILICEKTRKLKCVQLKSFLQHPTTICNCIQLFLVTHRIGLEGYTIQWQTAPSLAPRYTFHPLRWFKYKLKLSPISFLAPFFHRKSKSKKGHNKVTRLWERKHVPIVRHPPPGILISTSNAPSKLLLKLVLGELRTKKPL